MNDGLNLEPRFSGSSIYRSYSRASSNSEILIPSVVGKGLMTAMSDRTPLTFLIPLIWDGMTISISRFLGGVAPAGRRAML